jgi:hypothetical protein
MDDSFSEPDGWSRIAPWGDRFAAAHCAVLDELPGLGSMRRHAVDGEKSIDKANPLLVMPSFKRQGR